MLERKTSLPLPEGVTGPDVRFPDGLVEYFLERHTSPGDIVLDPFAGLGTAVVRAIQSGRRGFGVECDPGTAEKARELAGCDRCIVCGDSRMLSSFGLPRFDLCITSPPYPFVGPRAGSEGSLFSPDRGYGSYLEGLGLVFTQVRELMNPGAVVVVEAGNLSLDTGVLTLAWDIADVLSKIFSLQGETVVCWDSPNYGFEHSYCLEFTTVQPAEPEGPGRGRA